MSRVVYAPAAEEMYSGPQLTTVTVANLTDGLCGPFRPGHFQGVTTVVCKLLMMAMPDRGYFGLQVDPMKAPARFPGGRNGRIGNSCHSARKESARVRAGRRRNIAMPRVTDQATDEACAVSQPLVSAWSLLEVR